MGLNLEEKWVVFGGVFSLLDVLGITQGFFKLFFKCTIQ